MGCVSGQPKNNELNPKNDSAYSRPLQNGVSQVPAIPQVAHQIPKHELASHAGALVNQAGLNEQLPKSSIHPSLQQGASNIKPPSDIINNSVPGSHVMNNTLNVNDINVSPGNIMVEGAPNSNIVEMESQEYIGSKIVKRGGVSGLQQVNTNDEDVVLSEGGANFTPAVRNINFHIQIS